MRRSLVRRVAGAILALLAIATPVDAASLDLPRDPRVEGLEGTRVWTQGDEVVRVDRDPNGKPRRCVRAARLDTPAEGGPSRLEFGVERAPSGSADITMFVRIQYLDGPNGKPLPVRDPMLLIARFGPAADWRLEASPGGWYRRSKLAAQSSDDERFEFMNETRRPGTGFVSTFPDGSHRLHHVRGGVSPWHFEMFGNCVCALGATSPKPAIRGFLCD